MADIDEPMSHQLVRDSLVAVLLEDRELRHVPGVLEREVDGQSEYAIAVAATLRSANIPTMLYTESDKLGKKLRYADRMGFEHVIVIGSSEVDGSTVSLKRMSAGTTERVSLDSLVSAIIAQ